MTKHYIGVLIQFILVALMGIATVIIPELLPLSTIISGAVFMACAYNNGLNKTLSLALAVIISSAITAVYLYGLSLTAAFTVISICLYLVLIGAAVGFGAKKKVAFISLIVYGGICCLLPVLITFLKLKVFDGIDLIEDFINKPVSEFFTAYTQLLPSNIEGIEEFKKIFGELQWYVKQTLAMIIPSCFIILCISAAYLVFAAGRKLLSKVFGINLDSYPLFRQLQMPKSTSIALAVLFIISFFTGTSNISGAITNIIIVLSFLYMICGISVIDNILFKKRIRPLIRIIIYIIALCSFAFIGILIPFLSLPSILLLLGVIDSSTDFRRLKRQDKGDTENER